VLTVMPIRTLRPGGIGGPDPTCLGLAIPCCRKMAGTQPLHVVAFKQEPLASDPGYTMLVDRVFRYGCAQEQRNVRRNGFRPGKLRHAVASSSTNQS
jgi:hypothetical protein